jgi:predicted esterase
MKHVKGTSRGSWPAPLIVLPKTQHTHTFILLHGLGSNGEKFGSELLESGVSSEKQTLRDVFPGAKFIFPTAKWRRSTAFNRAVLTQWFDVYSLDDWSQREDVQIEGLVDSAKYIRGILSEELKSVPATHIVLGGLSQGCAMSLIVLLSSASPLGAFVGMSGRLPFRNDIRDILNSPSEPDDNVTFGDNDAAEQPPAIQALVFVRELLEQDDNDGETTVTRNALATPVFLGHGAKDDKVPYRLGKEAASTLSLLGMQTTWKGYAELGHWYQVPEEIDDVIEFLGGIWRRE